MSWEVCKTASLVGQEFWSLGLALTACGGESTEADAPDGGAGVGGMGARGAPGSQSVTSAKSALERDASPDVEPKALDTLAQAEAEFALDLLPQVGAEGGNLIYSPLSIHQAMTMATTGAAGATLAEMQSVLHLDGLPEPHAAQNALDLALQAAAGVPLQEGETGEPLALGIANSLWGTPDITWKQPFLDTLAVNYGAGLQLTDFAANPEAARETINAWVEDQTNDRIQDLLPDGIITPMTVMVMVNAIFFKGSWSTAFTPDLTVDEPFHRAPGDDVEVPMMHGSADTYTAGEDYVAVSRNYSGGRASMVLIVPDDLAAFEAGFDAATYARITGALAPRAVELAMPRFEFKTAARLVEMLRALGMELPFDPGADFSGMTDETSLVISDVIHQAFVKVNEEGTEAAAATAVVFENGVASEPEPPVSVRADKPFLFIIRDNETQAILFLGRVADPSALAE